MLVDDQQQQPQPQHHDHQPAFIYPSGVLKKGLQKGYTEDQIMQLVTENRQKINDQVRLLVLLWWNLGLAGSLSL